MKKFNLLLIALLVLTILTVAGYIYFLQMDSANAKLKNEIRQLQQLKGDVQEAVVAPMGTKALLEKKSEYQELLQTYELKAKIGIKKNTLEIDGKIRSSQDYMMLKRLLAMIKSDQATLENVCIGQGCNEHQYGFVLRFSPFVLKYE